jgi:hypothetical protein
MPHLPKSGQSGLPHPLVSRQIATRRGKYMAGQPALRRSAKI